MNANDIDTLGHEIHTGQLMDEIREGKRVWDELAAEAEAKGKTWGDYATRLSSENRQCYRCGATVFFHWSGVENEPPRVTDQIAYARGTTPQLMEDPSTPCQMPVLEPTVLRFTCKSGRIALANDLRRSVVDARKVKDHRGSVDHHPGKVEHMKWYADHGYLTGHVYGYVWFIPMDGGLDVMHSNECRIDEDEWERLSEVCAHEYSTELWWFAIVDAADLPEGATDSYDREIGFMDLEPGEYECTVAPEDPNSNLVATLRRLETAP